MILSQVSDIRVMKFIPSLSSVHCIDSMSAQGVPWEDGPWLISHALFVFSLSLGLFVPELYMDPRVLKGHPSWNIQFRY